MALSKHLLCFAQLSVACLASNSGFPRARFHFARCILLLLINYNGLISIPSRPLPRDGTWSRVNTSMHICADQLMPFAASFACVASIAPVEWCCCIG